MRTTERNGIVTEWETFKVTECCEVEAEWLYGGDKRCPECGYLNPRELKGERVKDRYPTSREST